MLCCEPRYNAFCELRHIQFVCDCLVGPLVGSSLEGALNDFQVIAIVSQRSSLPTLAPGEMTMVSFIIINVL